VTAQAKGGGGFSAYDKARLLVTVVVGEDGRPLFTEADIPALMDKSATVIDRLGDIAARMSGIDVGHGRPAYLQTLFPEKLIRALVDRGDSDAEILAAIDGDELRWWFDRLVSSPAKCRAVLAELRSQAASAEGKSGPPPMTTREEVERTRRDLASRERPAGERSIAAELGVSRDAVRYALGKDRHRRSGA